MSLKLAITKATDPFFFVYELLAGNRRLILPTIIGLVLALTVISHSGVLVESYQSEIFDEVVFQSQDDYSGHITIQLRSYGVRSESTSTSSEDYKRFTNYTIYENKFNEAITQANYKNYISEHFWGSTVDINVLTNSSDPWMARQYSSIYLSSTQEFYNRLDNILKESDSGRIPKNSSEIVLIRPQEQISSGWNHWSDNITLNSVVNLSSVQWDVKENKTSINQSVRVVGILEYQPKDEFSDVIYTNSTLLLWKYLDPNYFWYSAAFIGQPSHVDTLLKDISEPDTGNVTNNWYGNVYGKVYLEKSSYNSYDIKNEIQNLGQLLQILENQFYGLSSFPEIDSAIYSTMKQYETTILGLIVLLLILSAPIVSISFYLVIYSFGLIRRQKQEQIGIIKTRGGSWAHILGVLIGEIVISTLIAIIIGFILSIFLADIVMRSTNYLEFSGTSVPVKASIGLLQQLVIWGLLFALILNFIRIIRMSRQKITETHIPIEVNDPFWKRYHVDFILFILGTLAWIIFLNLTRLPTGDSGSQIDPIRGYDSQQKLGSYQEPEGSADDLLLLIVSLIGIPAPFLILIGTTMIISRFFPIIIKKFADILWRIEGGISTFAVHNIVRHKQAANRAVLLITLALSFIILASSLTFSLDKTQQNQFYYEQGADIKVITGHVLNSTVYSILDKNISHVSSICGTYTAVHTTYNESFDESEKGFSDYTYRFMFIDPLKYSQTAFYSSNFDLSDSLSKMMSELSDNKSILLFKENIEASVSKPKIGENLSFLFRNNSHSEMLPFTIAGSFKYWPTFYPYDYYQFTNDFWIIGSLGMFEQLNKSAYLDSVSANYLIKLDNINNAEKTVSQIESFTQISPSSAALSYKKYQTSFVRHFRLSVLNSDLLFCFTVAVIGVIMFAFFTYIERGKEIGVERALGMTQFQTARIFLVESLLILIFGSIIGFITGSYFVIMFLQVIQLGESIPPVVVTYPMNLILRLILGTIIISGIGSIIPAYLATRKDISQILKVE